MKQLIEIICFLSIFFVCPLSQADTLGICNCIESNGSNGPSFTTDHIFLDDFDCKGNVGPWCTNECSGFAKINSRTVDRVNLFVEAKCVGNNKKIRSRQYQRLPTLERYYFSPKTQEILELSAFLVGAGAVAKAFGESFAILVQNLSEVSGICTGTIILTPGPVLPPLNLGKAKNRFPMQCLIQDPSVLKKTVCEKDDYNPISCEVEG